MYRRFEESTSSQKKPKFDHLQFTPLHSLAQLHGQPFDGSLSSLSSEDDTSHEETGPFLPLLAPEIETMEGPMQLGTEGTVDDDRVMYDVRGQDVEEALKELSHSTGARRSPR